MDIALENELDGKIIAFVNGEFVPNNKLHTNLILERRIERLEHDVSKIKLAQKTD